MEQEQIIKALECCTSLGGCYGCPLSYDYAPTTNCKLKLLKFALALINEFIEENKAKTNNPKLIETIKGIKGDTIEEYRKKVYRKMEKHTIFGREYIQRIMREIAKEMLGE